MLPATGLTGAKFFAERLRAAISQLALEHEGIVLRTTVSIGLGHWEAVDGGELQALLLLADRALYRAKRAGRDRVAPPAA